MAGELKPNRARALILQAAGLLLWGSVLTVIFAFFFFPGEDISAYLSRRVNRAVPMISMNTKGLRSKAVGLAADRIELVSTGSPALSLFWIQDFTIRPTGMGFGRLQFSFTGKSGDGDISGTIQMGRGKTVLAMALNRCRIGFPRPFFGFDRLKVEKSLVQGEIRGDKIHVRLFRATLRQGTVTASGIVDSGGAAKDGRLLDIHGTLVPDGEKPGKAARPIAFSMTGPLARPQLKITGPLMP